MVKTNLCIYVEDTTAEKLRRVAGKTNKSMAKIVEKLILENLEE